MKKHYLLIAAIALLSIAAKAQTSDKRLTTYDPATKTRDSLAINQIILPAEKAAGEEAPDWSALTQAITKQYDATTADRTTTKAKIYFYYNKDWPTFCAGIVNYTNHYELADDYKLLDLNAGMIAQYSTDQSQLKEALRWAKAAADSDPGNEKYKATYEGLKAKITQ